MSLFQPYAPYALKPISRHSLISQALIERAGLELNQSKILNAEFDFLASKQAELYAFLHLELERIRDEYAKSFVYFIIAHLSWIFRTGFPQKPQTISKEALKLLQESLKLESELRENSATETIDLGDLLKRYQPYLVHWIHEHMDASSDLASFEVKSVSVRDFERAYELCILLCFAFSYANTPPQAYDS